MRKIDCEYCHVKDILARDVSSLSFGITYFTNMIYQSYMLSNILPILYRSLVWVNTSDLMRDRCVLVTCLIDGLKNVRILFQMDAHLDSCTLRPWSCTLSEFGCPFKGTCKELLEHLTFEDHVSCHTSLFTEEETQRKTLLGTFEQIYIALRTVSCLVSQYSKNPTSSSNNCEQQHCIKMPLAFIGYFLIMIDLIVRRVYNSTFNS